MKKITVSYRDIHWKEQTITLTGFPAQICQHELDHLEVVLFRLKSLVLLEKYATLRLMKILIPTAKEMNTNVPSLEAKPLCPESQAVLDELNYIFCSRTGKFL